MKVNLKLAYICALLGPHLLCLVGHAAIMTIISKQPTKQQHKRWPSFLFFFYGPVHVTSVSGAMKHFFKFLNVAIGLGPLAPCMTACASSVPSISAPVMSAQLVSPHTMSAQLVSPHTMSAQLVPPHTMSALFVSPRSISACTRSAPACSSMTVHCTRPA